jgi:hypothetical protein
MHEIDLETHHHHNHIFSDLAVLHTKRDLVTSQAFKCSSKESTNGTEVSQIAGDSFASWVPLRLVTSQSDIGQRLLLHCYSAWVKAHAVAGTVLVQCLSATESTWHMGGQTRYSEVPLFPCRSLTAPVAQCERQAAHCSAQAVQLESIWRCCSCEADLSALASSNDQPANSIGRGTSTPSTVPGASPRRSWLTPTRAEQR